MPWKRNKYQAKAVEKNGMRFDSKMEGRYYEKLLLLQKTGEIDFFLRQVPIHLPGGVKYLCDFLIFFSDGKVKFIDVKGVDTPMSKLKRKQCEDLYPIEIELVTKV